MASWVYTSICAIDNLPAHFCEPSHPLEHCRQPAVKKAHCQEKVMYVSWTLQSKHFPPNSERYERQILKLENCISGHLFSRKTSNVLEVADLASAKCADNTRSSPGAGILRPGEVKALRVFYYPLAGISIDDPPLRIQYD